MNEQGIFILVSVVTAIVIIALFVFMLIRKKQNKDTDSKALTPLAGLAFACITAGIVFGEERWLGYGLMGLGVVLAVIDAVRKFKITR
jgi:hypothetical protein